MYTHRTHVCPSHAKLYRARAAQWLYSPTDRLRESAQWSVHAYVCKYACMCVYMYMRTHKRIHTTQKSMHACLAYLVFSSGLPFSVQVRASSVCADVASDGAVGVDVGDDVKRHFLKELSHQAVLPSLMCMYVCMYVLCMCVCMYSYACRMPPSCPPIKCMHVCMYVCMFVCIHACFYACMPVCMHYHLRTCTRSSCVHA